MIIYYEIRSHYVNDSIKIIWIIFIILICLLINCKYCIIIFFVNIIIYVDNAIKIMIVMINHVVKFSLEMFYTEDGKAEEI